MFASLQMEKFAMQRVAFKLNGQFFKADQSPFSKPFGEKSILKKLVNELVKNTLEL